MKLEVGKRYIRGDGKITAKLEKYGHNSAYLFCPYTRNLYVRDTGHRYSNYSESEKLVEEFVDVAKDTLFVKAPTKKQLVGAIDQRHRELAFALVSVNVNSSKSIELVVGAPFREHSACTFNKTSLAKLIEELQAIHDVME